VSPDDIDQLMQQVMDEHLDDHTLQLTVLWAAAWEDVRDMLESALSSGDRSRLERALARVEDRIGRLASDAGATIGSSVRAAAGLGADGQGLMIAVQGPNPARVPDRQLEAIVARCTQNILANTAGITPAVMDRIKRDLTRGIAVGDNPRTVARGIMADLEDDFNGGLPRALNISRTEMIDAMRTAQTAVDRVNANVLQGWVWYAHLDSKTCPACAAMHGTVHPVDEDGPDDHPSGRCARMPLTRSWADLGLDGVPETQVQPETAQAWFEGLDEKDQRSLLGRSRYEAWTRGDYPMTQWAEKRHNDGWRDSIRTTPAPKEGS
jgi:SPP1 gp7 family putative phage head morphogenesis protein